MERNNFVLLFLFLVQLSYGQFQRADKFFLKRDYEKAAELYVELFKNDGDNQYYYSSLFNSYLKLNDFDAAEKLPSLERFVFASSAAVYGMRSMYSQEIIPEDVPLAPPNHYGIWKLAGEHVARLFYDNTKVPTVCLRLNTTYGKGRDKGKTSAPTNALKAIAMGSVSGELMPFEMPYQGRENYHFVEDVGAQFAAVTIQTFEGFEAFNIQGETIPIKSFLEIAENQAKELGIGDFASLSIVSNAPPNLFICDLDHLKITSTFSNLPMTDISEGIRKSLIEFRAMAEKGTLAYSTPAS